jgi:hypothetical protein
MNTTALPSTSRHPFRDARPSGRGRVRSLVSVGLTAGLAVASVAAGAPVHAATTDTRPAFTITDRTTARQVKAHEIGYLMASCNTGEERISGGFYNTAPAYSSTLPQLPVPDRYPVIADRPNGSLSWTVGLLNRTDGDTQLIVHVLCASIPLGGVVVKADGAAYDPNSTSGGITANCPAGTVVTGGGWDVGAVHRLNQVISLGRSIPIHAAKTDGWMISTGLPRYSSAPATTQVTAYAVCVAGDVARSNTLTSPFTVPGGSLTEATRAQPSVSCPAGTVFTRGLLTGVGVELSRTDGTLSLTSLAPSQAGVPSKWTATVNSLAGPGTDSRDNLGGTGSLFPDCVHPPLLASASIGTAPRRIGQP